LDVNDLPVGDMGSWADDQLGLDGLDKLAKGNLDLSLAPTKKTVKIDGSLDISSLFTALSGGTIPLPSLKLNNPSLTYENNVTGTAYSFSGQDPTDKVNYTVSYNKYIDNTYEFKLDNFPVGKITSWLDNSLGISGLSKAITGNLDVTIGSQLKKLEFDGTVNIGALINTISGNTLSLGAINLEKPTLSYFSGLGKTEYIFSTNDMTLSYTKNATGAGGTFFADNIPVAGITSWIGKEIGISSFGNIFSPGAKLDFLSSPTEKSISLQGDFNVGELANLIAFGSLPDELKSAKLSNPSFTKKTNDIFFSGSASFVLGNGTFADFNEIAALLPGTEQTAGGLKIEGDIAVSRVNGSYTIEAEVPLIGAIKLGQVGGKWKLQAVADGDRLTLVDLGVVGTSGGEYTFKDLFNYQFKGDANLGLKTKTSIQNNAYFPAFSFDLAAKFPLFDYSNKEQASKNGMNIALKNMELDAGSFVTKFARPFIKLVNETIDPARPLISLATRDHPILSELPGIEKILNYDKKDGVNVLDILEFGANDPNLRALNPLLSAEIRKYRNFVKAVITITEIIDDLDNTPEGQSYKIPFGDYTIVGAKGASTDKANYSSNLTVNPNDIKNVQQPTVDTSNVYKSSINKLSGLEGLQFPILTSPMNAFNLLLGKPADLIKYEIPGYDIKADIDTSKIKTGIGIVDDVLAKYLPKFSAYFDMRTDFVLGFDTAGYLDWKNSGYKAEDFYKIFDGAYVEDFDANGVDRNEFYVKSGAEAELKLDMNLLKATFTPGWDGSVNFDLEDVGEKNGTNDGKVRASEIISRLDNPLSLFELYGELSAYLSGKVEVGINTYLFGEWYTTLWETDLGRMTLAEFRLDENGFSGSLFGGKLSTSYIADARVFLDVNFNGLLDEGEPVTKTDSNGEFSLNADVAKYDTNSNGKIDPSEGQIVAVGGVDTSSGVPLDTQLTSAVGDSMITPLTHLQNYLVNAGLVTDKEASQKLLSDRFNLGLTAGIDLKNFDPLATIGSETGATQGIGVEVYLAHVQ
ncbi:MAG: hypothetical protein ACRC2J_05330, partial [Microcoleaceae cyanobacterium]